MKTSFLRVGSVMGWALLAPIAAAQTPGPLRVLAQGEPAEQRIERRFMFHPETGAAEKEKVAFLGVETAPISPPLTAQLGLPRDTGLVVRHVVEGSPAAAVLQEHDILLRFGDQMLIEPRQFSVLVRNHREGDEVELTYLRGGKEGKAKVKLAMQEVPKRIAFEFGPEAGDLDVLIPAPGGVARRQEMDRVLSLLDQRDLEKGERPLLPPAGPGFRALTMNTGNSTMVYTDESGTLDVTLKDGRKTLVAKNAKGEQVYSGPVDTPPQRAALPADVRERLERIEGMHDFSFEIGDAFRADEAAPRPLRRKISVPLKNQRIEKVGAVAPAI